MIFIYKYLILLPNNLSHLTGINQQPGQGELTLADLRYMKGEKHHYYVGWRFPRTDNLFNMLM